MKLKKKIKKKWIIIAVAVVLLAVVLLRACSGSAQQAVAAVETGTVETRSLVSSVGATGTVISVEKKDITTTLSGIDVSEVYVEVGDTVTAGQSLVAFDTEDIEEDLETAEKNLSTSKSQNSLTLDNAQRNVDDAKRAESYSVDQAAESRDDAYQNYKDASDDYDEAIDDLDDLKDDESDAKAALASASARLTKAQTAYNTVSSGDASYTTVQNEYIEAMTAYQNAETAYSAAVSARQAKETEANNYAEQADNYLDSYNDLVKSYNKTVADQASSVASAENSKKSAALSANTDTEQKQVDTYEEQLEKGVLTAPIAGVVTAVNVDEGDTYTQGTIVTIQDCSSYEIEAEIGEYDISDIELGQKVLIKTDATRDEELEGTVTFISPTATAGGSSVTYTVKISVDTPNDRLRLDMTASLSIILEEHDNVMTVPYNAVQTDDDGNSYVEVYNGDGAETTKVYVTVVLESNYYTEVFSDELTEGQQVVIKSDDSSSTDDMMEFMIEGEGF